MITPDTSRWSLAALLVLIPMYAQGQQSSTEWHPALKELWQDQASWQLITPSDLNLDPDMLAGRRAVYQRQENLVRDPLTEETGFQFERGWLKGEPILIARFYTSGDPEHAESGPSWWTMTLEPRSMQSFFSVSASSRWGSFVSRRTETGTINWGLRPDSTAWTGPDVTDGHEPMIDLSVWGFVLASLPLADGMKFRLQSFRGFPGSAFHVAGRTMFEDTKGRSHRVWAVETNMGRNGWLGITYVRDQAPFFMGFEMRHVESGDVNIRWRLESFERLGGQTGVFER